jgi:hypothetical protein
LEVLPTENMFLVKPFHMAAAVVDQCIGVVTNLECTKVNGSFPCLCCEKLKVDLQKVINEL